MSVAALPAPVGEVGPAEAAEGVAGVVAVPVAEMAVAAAAWPLEAPLLNDMALSQRNDEERCVDTPRADTSWWRSTGTVVQQSD